MAVRSGLPDVRIGGCIMRDTCSATTRRSRAADGGFDTMATQILPSGSAAALALTSGCRTAPHAKDDAATETQLQPAGIDTTARPFDEHFYVVPPQDVHG